MKHARLVTIIRRLFIILGVALVVFMVSLLLPPTPHVGEPEKVMVVVRRGAELDEIADILKENDLIRSKSMFVLAAKAMGVERKLQAGRFTLERTASIFDLIRQLVEGMSRADLITIPEGLTAAEIAELLEREILLEPKAFLALVGDSSCSASLGVKAASLEGYLFPDTYALVPGMGPFEVLREMVMKGRSVLGPKLRDRASAMGLTWHQVVTFASIVEGEARVPEERPRIAAVYWNRLKRGMRLQADPTVAYALGARKQRILYRDLDVISPYNTYLVKSLPPGPINNPGKASILAVLYPLEGCRDLYFVSRGDGAHIFSRTMEEHAAATRAVRAARSAARAGASKSDTSVAGTARVGSTAGAGSNRGAAANATTGPDTSSGGGKAPAIPGDSTGAGDDRK
jgi:UPF0755 protein